jgi:RNA polymerase sigma factor (sigma-70 family)
MTARTAFFSTHNATASNNPQQKNKHTTEQLYVEHHRWLFSWLCKKVGCVEQAADFAQDTFCRLLTAKSLTELKQPRAFLTTTATRILVDACRRKQVEQQYLEHYYYYHGEQASVISEENLAIITESLLHIIALLSDLPAICQQAFLMNRLEGLRHKEIAEKLNIAPSTAKKYIAKALLHCHMATA